MDLNAIHPNMQDERGGRQVAGRRPHCIPEIFEKDLIEISI
jgi:hypothetical protein